MTTLTLYPTGDTLGHATEELFNFYPYLGFPTFFSPHVWVPVSS